MRVGNWVETWFIVLNDCASFINQFDNFWKKISIRLKVSVLGKIFIEHFKTSVENVFVLEIAHEFKFAKTYRTQHWRLNVSLLNSIWPIHYALKINAVFDPKHVRNFMCHRFTGSILNKLPSFLRVQEQVITLLIFWKEIRIIPCEREDTTSVMNPRHSEDKVPTFSRKEIFIEETNCAISISWYEFWFNEIKDVRGLKLNFSCLWSYSGMNVHLLWPVWEIDLFRIHLYIETKKEGRTVSNKRLN